MILLDTWNTLKQQADKSDAEVLGRLEKAYVASYVRLEPEIQALIEQLEAMMKSGKVTQSQVKNSQAYKNLMREVRQELDDYSAYLRTEVTTSVNESAKQGLRAGDLLLVTAIALSLGVDVKDVPKDTITQPDSLDFLAKYLAKDSPLFERINGLSNYHGEQIAEGILQRVGEGMNPRLIGEWMIDAYGYPLNDALRTMRTVQLYSYRDANLATMKANSDLLNGWIWDAELDDVCCPVCVSMHGTIHTLDETMDSHFNCRCSPIPYVKGADNPLPETGEDWLSNQDESMQKQILGAKYDGWSNGDFKLSDVIGNYESEVFGNMLIEKPLKDLTGGN